MSKSRTAAMLRAASGAAGGGGGGGGAFGDAVTYWDFSTVATVWKDTGLTSPVTADADIIKGVTGSGTDGIKASEATNGPAWKAAYIGTLGAALFDGSNDQLTSTGTGAVNPVTIYAVAALTATNQGTKYLFGEANNTDVVSIRDSGPNYGLGAPTAQTGIVADTNAHVLTVTWDGVANVLYVDGVADTPGSTAAGAWGDFGLGFLGGAGVGFCAVAIGEFAVYHSIHDAPTIAAKVATTKTKWGIA